MLRALLPHRETAPLPELWAALLSEVQSISVRNQALEDLLSRACLSELLLQPAARERDGRRTSELPGLRGLTRPWPGELLGSCHGSEDMEAGSVYPPLQAECVKCRVQRDHGSRVRGR